MMTASVMSGRADNGVIVCTTLPGILNVIGSGSTPGTPSRSMLANALAQLIASRRLPTPLSSVLVTVRLQSAAENSDVLGGGGGLGLARIGVAVAVTNRPAAITPLNAGDVSVTFPAASVKTFCEPRKVW